MDDIRKYKNFSVFKHNFLLNLPKNYTSPEMIDQCWEWQGARFNTNYGLISWGTGSPYLAHRISYIIFKGLIPNGKIIRHTCDNPGCVNPKHLLLGTKYDNAQDAVLRGRTSRIGCIGDKSNLNSEAVKVIKWMLKYKNKPGLQNKLAKLYGISKSAISNIKHNRRWAHIEV